MLSDIQEAAGGKNRHTLNLSLLADHMDDVKAKMLVDAADHSIRICGYEWVYCNGDCKSCSRGKLTYSNRTEEK